WAQEATKVLNEHSGFTSAIANVDLSLQFKVTDSPSGEVAYHFVMGGGQASVALGETEDADVTVANNYDTAVAISKGDLNTQAAFMTGKLKVSGNLAKLMMHQAALTSFASAVEPMDVDY
ncbi:MAG TPA: SCP2 sterol-binding domain-containing protein, partial [Actinobacteria bacterium]|nr:SCP2 sterol-binding domain-containing protein [Actinomycetota bacterium]